MTVEQKKPEMYKLTRQLERPHVYRNIDIH